MTTMREKLAKKLIDLDPVFSGYHQSHLDAMYPKVDAILSVLEEPDEGMIKAMSREMGQAIDGEIEKYDSDFVKDRLRAGFRAAIRSIRKGGEG